MIRYKRPYLDTSVYIATIQGEATRVDVGKLIFAAADRSDVQIVASTFVAAEVIRHQGEPGGVLPPESEAAIDTILRSDRIVWVELDLVTAVEARHLAREHGLRPADAVHLASALRGGADVLLRWDKRFSTKPDYSGLTVCDPYWYGDVPIDGLSL